jgi:Bacterial Ig-like domain
MSNIVLSRVESVKVGPVGSAESACDDLGSVRTTTLAVKYKSTVARQANAGGAVGAVALSEPEGTLAIVAEEVTNLNVAKALNAEVDGEGVSSDGNIAEPEEFCAYVRGYRLNGQKALLHVARMYFEPDNELPLGEEQQLLNFNGVLMVDPDGSAPDGAKFWNIKPVSTDVTPPTVQSIVPANNATAVAKAATTLVVWTFAEAVMAADAKSDKFLVHDATGAVKAGTLSHSGAVVTFTPTSAWAATTVYYPTVMPGVRDVVGNKLAAPSVTMFTTGS